SSGGGGGGGGAAGTTLSGGGELSAMTGSWGGIGGFGGLYDGVFNVYFGGGGGGGGGGTAALLNGGNYAFSSGTITGGKGGAGGAGGYGNATTEGGGGGGGGGGYGVLLTDGALENGGTITGGSGSTGGDGRTGGNGGGGAAGARLIDSDLENTGILSGGSGGGGGRTVLQGATAGGRGGNGGAGGSGVQVSRGDVINHGSISGGDGGGGGGARVTEAEYGGFGGDGGYGVQLSGGHLENSGSITGGSGSAGGWGSQDADGGAGGGGVQLLNGTLENKAGGVITGGTGGQGESGGRASGGAGGAAMVAIHATIINDGIITGGMSGDNTIRSNAITFDYGTNTLELHSHSEITGHVVGTGDDKLVLGGLSNGTFDAASIGSQYTGFSDYAKTGSSTWELTGTATEVMDWQVEEGRLVVSAALMGGTATVEEGATLELKTGGSLGDGTVDIRGALRGSGTIAGETTVAGLLAADGLPGTRLLFETGLTLSPDATTNVSITPGQGHTSIAAPSLIYEGSLTITLGGFLTGEDEWLLLDAESMGGEWSSVTLDGDFYHFSLTNTDGEWTANRGGYLWSFNESTGLLAVASIPEPAAGWLGIAGFAVLGWHQWRRKTASRRTA
ncbi:MAG TPA: hypothetical protein VNQ90_14645, partial [Chthoniobacteraceae bacterium]|nr:hypothetical protein [Chthoniobacteraceae bacterium]